MKTELTHTELIEALHLAAPSISITVMWTYDDDGAAEWDDLSSNPGDCFYGTDRDDWVCWQTTTTASVIIDGEEIEGSDYLGGTWEKYDESPWVVNPDISGYFPDKARVALEELAKQLPCGHPLHEEITAALALL